MDEDLREIVLNAVSDLVSDFVDYDRKEDEDLSRGQLQAAIHDNTVTVEEIVAQFRNDLLTALKD